MMKKENINFLIKFILALIPVFLIVGFIALCPDCYMDEEYPAWKYTKNYVRASGDDADILILGDSRAMADLIPDVLTDGSGKTCVNIAVGGATPMEMYYFYVDYLKNHEAPHTAIVMFAPFHYTYMDNYKTRTLYFNALTYGEYSELLKVADRYDSESVLFKDQAQYHLSCAMKLPDVYLPAIYNARFIGRKADNEKRYNDLVISKGQGYFGTADGNSDKAYEATYSEMTDNGDAKLLTFYAEALYALLSSGCENVILVQPPMNETTYDNLKESYVNQYKEYIKNICMDYDNIFCSYEFERYENEYFGDSSHLNEKGANKYSAEFREKYKNLYLE